MIAQHIREGEGRKETKGLGEGRILSLYIFDSEYGKKVKVIVVGHE